MHQTRIRPDTEPYDIWCARRKMQQRALKEYMRTGIPRWRSNILVMRNPKQVTPPRVRHSWKRYLRSNDLRSIELQGTYVANRCFICGKKDKPSKCKCYKLAL